ncbi:MAG: hypothetical protein C7B47_15065 [Sulfobacillus thermosulfidooxidans]|uniref:Uncharacterized protein n=1 Tax=Sulfobacillus thermosulfidooxidans TaxID=28034 RepID=A0A2T2WQ03_SULTH|nr:MAG: hypothetical protein C7B47_15065 [Sulfobacillus thermosulfidooxidans]
MGGLSPLMIRRLYAEEHAELVRCYGEWERTGQCSPELWRRVCRHHELLKLLVSALQNSDKSPTAVVPLFKD